MKNALQALGFCFIHPVGIDLWWTPCTSPIVNVSLSSLLKKNMSKAIWLSLCYFTEILYNSPRVRKGGEEMRTPFFQNNNNNHTLVCRCVPMAPSRHLPMIVHAQGLNGNEEPICGALKLKSSASNSDPTPAKLLPPGKSNLRSGRKMVLHDCHLG